MSYLDPTYLRYIYDNLIKESIHPQNASELPDGLIGLYEEAFEEHLPVMERQQTLKRFVLFAFLKKEVSVSFVAEVLEESEGDLLTFISAFSSWFNSPESGKYQLYHERLKVYLLQKLSEKEIQTIHQKLIFHLEKAIEEQQADEFERYALEFLSEHLLVEAFENEANGKRLLDFTKNEANWDRQIRISNKFDWSRKGLHHAASWTSKHDQEENIDCYLDLVQLHNKEQNDAESIVRLVANNEIDLALERITAFGDKDKEGQQRKFILYILCFMELTLSEGKDIPFTKNAINKILNHFDENITEDHVILNWSEFIPSVLIFKIACVLDDLNLDYLILFKRTSYFELTWIHQDSNMKILLKKYELIFKISNFLKLNESKIYERCIIVFCKISSIFFKENDQLNASFYLQNAIDFCNSINQEINKSSIYLYITQEFLEQLDFENAEKYSKLINDKKDILNYEIAYSLILIKNNFVKEAITKAENVFCEIKYYNLDSYCNVLSVELLNRNFVLQAFSICSKIEDELLRNKTIEKIVNEIKIDNVNLEIILEEEFFKNENNFKNFIISNFRKFIDSGKYVEIINFVNKILDIQIRLNLLIIISSELYFENKENEAQIILKKCLIESAEIEDESLKTLVQLDISLELELQNNIEESEQLWNDLIYKVYQNNFKHSLLIEFVAKLAKAYRLIDAEEIIELIEDSFYYEIALGRLLLELIYWNEIDRAFNLAYNFYSDVGYFDELHGVIDKIAIELALVNNKNDALRFNKIASNSIVMNRIYQSDLKDQFGNPASTLTVITYELSKLKRFDDAFFFVNQMVDFDDQNFAFKIIYGEMLNNIQYNEISLELTNRIKLIHNKLVTKDNKYFDKSRKYNRNLIQIKDIHLKALILNYFRDNFKILFILISKIDDLDVKYYVIEKLLIYHLKSDTDYSKIDIFLSNIIDVDEKDFAIDVFRKELMKNKEISLAIKYTLFIQESRLKSYAFEEIIIELIKKNQINEAINLRNELKNAGQISNFYFNLTVAYLRNGNLNEASESLNKVQFNIYDLLFQIKEEIFSNENNNSNYLKFKNMDNIKHLFFEFDSNNSLYSEGIKCLNKEEILLGLTKILEINGKENLINKALNECYTIFINNIDNVFFVLSYLKEYDLSLYYKIKNRKWTNQLFEKIVKDGRYKKALDLAKKINLLEVGQYKKNSFERDIQTISLELIKNGFYNDYLNCFSKIEDSKVKSEVLLDVTNELFKQKKYSFSETESLKIPHKNYFYFCWRDIAKNQIQENGAIEAFEILSKLKKEEVRKYYLKGWTENVSINEFTQKLLFQVLPLIKDDSEAIENLIKIHVLNTLFTGIPSKEPIQRFKETLNLQWAIDLKKELDELPN